MDTVPYLLDTCRQYLIKKPLSIYRRYLYLYLPASQPASPSGMI